MLSEFLILLARFVEITITILSWLIIFRAIISWVSPDPFNPIVQFLYRTTDPILAPIRKVMPSLGPLDLSAIAAFFILNFIRVLLVRFLFNFAGKFSF
ncbi:MAG: YggT family protein [Candidatus Omnitrophota bacterium]